MIGVSLMGSAILDDSVGLRGVGDGSHRLTGFEALALVLVWSALPPGAPFACDSRPPSTSLSDVAARGELFLVDLFSVCGASPFGLS